MENKKIKLTISGIAKKTIKSIEIAKTQGKNSVVIEKQPNKFINRGGASRSSITQQKPSSISNRAISTKSTLASKPSSTTNDFERRQLAEQRATKRLKTESDGKDKKLKSGTGKRELKLTVSRALSDEIEARSRSMASLKRAKLKENRELTKKKFKKV